jgi:hypothetical protein
MTRPRSKSTQSRRGTSRRHRTRAHSGRRVRAVAQPSRRRGLLRSRTGRPTATRRAASRRRPRARVGISGGDGDGDESDEPGGGAGQDAGEPGGADGDAPAGPQKDWASVLFKFAAETKGDPVLMMKTAEKMVAEGEIPLELVQSAIQKATSLVNSATHRG